MKPCNCFDCQLVRAGLPPADRHAESASSEGKAARLPVPIRPMTLEGLPREERTARINQALREGYDRKRAERGVPLEPLERGELLATIKRRMVQFLDKAPPLEFPDWVKETPEVLRLAAPGGSFPCGNCGEPAIARLKHGGWGICSISAKTGEVCCSHLIPDMAEL